jgi:hypothetical protein
VNWFGLFTIFLGFTLVVIWFAYEIGYERAVKDMMMSRKWVYRNNEE